MYAIHGEMGRVGPRSSSYLNNNLTKSVDLYKKQTAALGKAMLQESFKIGLQQDENTKNERL